MRRAAFDVTSKNGQLYQAQVDGVLAEVANSDRKLTKVILEVKPFLRFDHYHTRYEEAAQMVAWIATEHLDDDASWPADKDSLYR